ncbi:hypothetical protein GPECTOR_133g611 [Gonium pectorale]|uniref:Uncharacterized protein n=1 Tax=Gonium pectorale TaxID=33097 RepID=A0A150FY80_GONPE|nr:hypothetical protein GPECTOR_133g611 [Gonium pectorale]|eukprot:KXZ42572.1 hypothetical protein GPECTOR_133g611 [Gonium pectorale]
MKLCSWASDMEHCSGDPGSGFAPPRHVDSVPVISFNDRFVVVWPISIYPPDESALSAVLTATVSPKVDSTKPVISASANTVKLESPTAAVVTLPPVTATDDFYLTAPVTCTPPSGSVFPLGTTTVSDGI